jgi:hypothetical protein
MGSCLWFCHTTRFHLVLIKLVRGSLRFGSQIFRSPGWTLFFGQYANTTTSSFKLFNSDGFKTWMAGFGTSSAKSLDKRLLSSWQLKTAI